MSLTGPNGSIPVPVVVKPGSPCPCGSGLQYLACCQSTTNRFSAADMVRTVDLLGQALRMMIGLEGIATYKRAWYGPFWPVNQPLPSQLRLLDESRVIGQNFEEWLLFDVPLQEEGLSLAQVALTTSDGWSKGMQHYLGEVAESKLHLYQIEGVTSEWLAVSSVIAGTRVRIVGESEDGQYSPGELLVGRLGRLRDDAPDVMAFTGVPYRFPASCKQTLVERLGRTQDTAVVHSKKALTAQWNHWWLELVGVLLSSGVSKTTLRQGTPALDVFNRGGRDS